MNLKFRNYDEKQFLPKFQEGGEMPAGAPEGAPADQAPVEGEGGDPTQQILEAAMAALQNQDCNLAMQVLQAIVQMIGGGAEQAPAAPEGQAPVYKKGGRLSYWVNK